MKLKFNVHDSISDCEMCGIESNDIVSVGSVSHDDFVPFETGTYAHCFDVEEANYPELIEHVLSELRRLGFDIPEPEWKLKPEDPEMIKQYKEKFEVTGLVQKPWGEWPKEVDWDLYWLYQDFVSYPYEEDYYTYYGSAVDLDNPKSFVSYLTQHGIEVEVEHTADDLPDYDAYGFYDDDDSEE